VEAETSDELLELGQKRPVNDRLGEIRVELFEIIDIEENNANAVVLDAGRLRRPEVKVAVGLRQTVEDAKLLLKLPFEGRRGRPASFKLPDAIPGWRLVGIGERARGNDARLC